MAFTLVPGVHGFGTADCTAGRGSIVRVTNLNASGSGSLANALTSGGGNKTIVFEVGGPIDRRGFDTMDVDVDGIRIAGQTAPSPGITVLGGIIRLRASNFLCEHMRFRPGDSPGGQDFDNRDSLLVNALARPVDRVIFHQCSFSWSVDELFSMWQVNQSQGRVTLAHCMFNSPLHDSQHSEGAHGFGPLLGEFDTWRISLIKNIFAHHQGRAPLSRCTHVAMVNNIWYDIKGDKASSGSGSNNVTHSYAGNLLVDGPISDAARPITLKSDGKPFQNSDRIYLENNGDWDNSPVVASNQWNLVDNDAGVSQGTVLLGSRPSHWNDLGDLTVDDISVRANVDAIINAAGSRPNDRGTGAGGLDFSNSSRDRVDEVLANRLNDALDQSTPGARTGGLIDSVAEGGGWPPLNTSNATYSEPSNPHVVQGSGYTNLEEDLNTLSASLQITSGDTFAFADASNVSTATRVSGADVISDKDGDGAAD